jgi:hypothetical protein
MSFLRIIEKDGMSGIAAFPPSLWVVEDHINDHKICPQKA